MTSLLQPDRVQTHGDAWVDAGLISGDQLAAIRRFEHLETPVPRRFSVAAEVAVYLGSLLALSGGAMVVARRWDGLPFAARLAVALLLVTVGFSAGAWSYRQGEPGTDRLAGFLSTVGLAGVAFAVGLIVERLGEVSDEVIVIVPGLAVMAAGGSVWRNRARPLEFSVVVGAGVAVAFATASLLGLDVWVAGVVLVLLGAVVAVAAAFGAIRPSELGVAAGAVVAYAGAFTWSDIDERLGAVAALVVALTLVAFATRRDEPPPLVLGVVGALIATQAVLATTFDGVLAAAVVALCGMVLVVGVIVRSTRRGAAPGH